MDFDKIILGENHIYTSNMEESRINNNILVMASSGAGKTHSIIEPCLLETNNSSVVLIDPKGVLYKKYGDYFTAKGYAVQTIDFDTLDGNCSYDPIQYLSTESDIIRLAHNIVYADRRTLSSNADPYWNESAMELLSSLIHAAVLTTEEGESYFERVLDLSQNVELEYDSYLNMLMKKIEQQHGCCLATRQWQKIYTLAGTRNTSACVISSLAAVLANYESDEFREFLRRDPVKLDGLSEKKTILFVKCSDSDPTYHTYVSLFFQQLIKSLFGRADGQKEGKLKIPVRLILDDFASTVVIEGMGRLLSTCRSRNISFTIVCQSESQLQQYYQKEANTILGNCDSIVFLGTSDLETARSFSMRLDIPMGELLYMPIGSEYIFRRGTRPMLTQRYDISKNEEYRKVIEQEKQR